MSERKRSQKGFVAVTIITLLAISLVIVAYATLLSTFTGDEVVVGTVAGSVWYSTDNTAAGPWTATLEVDNDSVSWYSMVNFTSGYTGQVSITWQLEKMTVTWGNVTGASQATTVELTGSGQEVYASATGILTGNRDWSGDLTGNGQYRVKAYIETT